VHDPEPGTAARLTVDLDAIRLNYRRLKAELGSVSCAGVVKADGYGLGAVRIAEALWREGCREYFVAHFEEGVVLREALPEARICILSGAVPGDEPEFAAHGLAPALNSLREVEAWAALCAKRGPLPALLHIDTGMSRLGLPADELDRLAENPRLLGATDLRYVMSHLCCAEEPEHPMNARQLAAFRAAVAKLPKAARSFANSSGVFLGAAYHFDLARPGSALYGLNPTPSRPNPMAPVATLEARLLQVRHVDPGGTVGYGAAPLARGTKIATIAIGYADGYRRAASARGRMHLAGYTLPVLGRVSMDTVTLDATEVPDAVLMPGAWVEIMGPSRDADAVAADCNTIAYEILTGLGRRLVRRYTGLSAR
jgi:alanine racemase